MMEKRNITFEPAGIVCRTEEGESLFQTAAKAGIRISGSCGGRGICGKCKIKILEGEVSEPGETEREQLCEKELKEGWRLSCLTYPQTDLRVEVPSEEGNRFDKKDMNLFPEDFQPRTTVEKTVLSVPPASLSDQRSHGDRFLCALESQRELTEGSLAAEYCCLKGLEAALKEGGGTVTAVLEDRRVLDAEPGDTASKNFGIAFDIGTTTVVGLLWDLTRGKNRATVARTNPQSVFGADVISRIHYAGESEAHLQEMSQRIRTCFNDIAGELCREAGISPRQIYRITVVGNTAMSHLFLGVDPSTLAQAPFAPAFCRAVELSAGELGLSAHPAAAVHVLPNIAGHVGSDITAVLLNSRLYEKTGLRVAVDIGTNGEILLAMDGRVFACSTAAGPAFEGAEIHQGMRAAPGAISQVKLIDGGVSLTVIGGARPVGICGSGLIDAVAEMLGAGLVDRTGRLIDPEKARESGMPEGFCARLKKGKAGGSFALFSAELDGGGEGEDVLLTQLDIRKVQLAKGAIAAGIRVMAAEAGADISDIESVVLAGAFGNFVRRESVLRIGLLPGDIPVERVIPIGNAAGAGASMALMSPEEYGLAKRLAAETAHVELSAHPAFQNEFIQAMEF